MRNLVLVVVLLAVGIAGAGYYRGWFAFSTSGTGQMPNATITVDTNKFREDEQKVRDDVQGLGKKAKDKIGGQTGNVNEPQRQP